MSKTQNKKNDVSKEQKDAKDFCEFAFKQHEELTCFKTADRLLDFFNGKYFEKAAGGNRFTHQTFFSVFNLLMPNLIFQQPYITAKSTKGRIIRKQDGNYQSILARPVMDKMENVINHEYKLIGAIAEDIKAVADCFFFPFGVTKTGYSYETTNVEGADYTVKDTIFHTRICPRDFGWHPLATSGKEKTMWAHRLYIPKKQLKNYDFIKESKLSDCDNELPKHLSKKLKLGKLQLKSKCISVHEVHDTENGMIYYYGGENKIFLGERKRKYEFNGTDFSILSFTKENDSFLGIPLLSAIEDEAVMLNEFLTLMMEHLRKFPGQIFMEKGVADDDDIEKIRTGEQGSIHILNTLESGKLQFKQPLNMGSEYFSVVALLQNLIDRALGIPDFQRGASTNRKSATEASYIQGDASMRRQYFMKQVKDFVLDGIQKAAGLKMQFADDENEIFVTGELGDYQLKYTKEEIQGEWTFDFDVDNMVFTNQAELNNIINLLNVLASQPALQPIIATLDMMKLANILFKKSNVNYQSVKKGEPENMVYVDPERENALARSGKPMPNPKAGENHSDHLKIHIDDLKSEGQNEAILSHIVDTIMLAKEEGKIDDVKQSGLFGAIELDQFMAMAEPARMVAPNQQPTIAPPGAPMPPQGEMPPVIQ